jgi:hypothetical protein
MAAATTNGDSFDNAHTPVAPAGLDALPFEDVVPTTSLDEARDRRNLLAFPQGKEPIAIVYKTSAAGDAHATPTLDADLVVSENGDPEDAGDETILDNTGTLFQAAVSTPRVVLIPESVRKRFRDNVDGNIALRLKVNTGAATAQEMTITGLLLVR